MQFIPTSYSISKAEKQIIVGETKSSLIEKTDKYQVLQEMHTSVHLKSEEDYSYKTGTKVKKVAESEEFVIPRLIDFYKDQETSEFTLEKLSNALQQPTGHLKNILL